MKIIREITYEGSEKQLRTQMSRSLRDDQFPYLTNITVRTLHSDVPGLTGENPEGWARGIDSIGALEARIEQLELDNQRLQDENNGLRIQLADARHIITLHRGEEAA